MRKAFEHLTGFAIAASTPLILGAYKGDILSQGASQKAMMATIGVCTAFGLLTKADIHYKTAFAGLVTGIAGAAAMVYGLSGPVPALETPVTPPAPAAIPPQRQMAPPFAELALRSTSPLKLG